MVWPGYVWTTDTYKTLILWPYSKSFKFNMHKYNLRNFIVIPLVSWLDQIRRGIVQRNRERKFNYETRIHCNNKAVFDSIFRIRHWMSFLTESKNILKLCLYKNVLTFFVKFKCRTSLARNSSYFMYLLMRKQYELWIFVLMRNC